MARCCCINPKASPPVPPTPAGSHTGKCINCFGPHSADDQCCPYWCHWYNHIYCHYF
ncbi:hypothetical protein P691DRAFT_680386 [Macrolepiota fuliginosa MF-IS2]|uniref:Uncharacterized protein n=1 Tax=Macrolepiota fuliginosa MF-IS2 TaxID=1400762 RepID=A0A9P5X1Z0_9AGAR|nr:hypothetical protein P691DRAFT_680386 [Macrolepiota fuliginosa MF-IS2]